jgi:hypothetical protein
MQWYLLSGLLPVTVMRSFSFFYRLICAVRDEAFQVNSRTGLTAWQLLWCRPAADVFPDPDLLDGLA